MIVSGIDEAGLGPLLGPYCAGLVTLSYRSQEKDPRLLCPAVLSEQPCKEKLTVGDSKKISSSKDISYLEETILAFYLMQYGRFPRSSGDFIKTVTDFPRELTSSEQEPWNHEIQSQTLPLVKSPEEIQKKAEFLAEKWRSAGLELSTFKLALVPPYEFNKLLDRKRNKAGACQEILKPLMQEGRIPGGKLIVDRQGGRRYYGEWLLDLYPGELLTARQETSQLSLYQSGECEIHFQVGADGVCFETALASMGAKYLREIYMKGFNRYWQKRYPGLKETAGYYSDGKRFLKDLRDAGFDEKELSYLVRKK